MKILSGYADIFLTVYPSDTLTGFDGERLADQREHGRFEVDRSVGIERHVHADQLLHSHTNTRRLQSRCILPSVPIGRLSLLPSAGR